MALETIHNIDKGVSRLYSAPTDIDLASPQGAARPHDEATAQHRKIYADYVSALRAIYPAVEKWWVSIVDSTQAQNGNERDVALRQAFMRRIAGPASDPQFVAVVREAWMRCATYNEAIEETERVAPQALLLGWLVEAGEAELVRLVTCMPYWPIGLDDKGNWC